MTLPALAPEPVTGPVPAGRETVACLACGSATARLLGTSAPQMAPPGAAFTWLACARCGLVYLSPRVPAEAVGAWYADYVPHQGPAAWGRWAGLVAWDERRVARARLARLRALGPLGPGSAVLDVGCGRPSFLRLVKDRTGARAVGTDFDDSGWSADPQAWQGLELHAGVVESLALGGPFHRITLWQVLEHLYDPVGTLRALRALAAPGARLVVEVPDHDGLTRRWHGMQWAGYHTPRHTAAYTPATLRQVLAAAGWRVEHQSRRATLDAYLLWWLGRQERQGRDWSAPLEPAFLPFLLGMLAWTPLALLERWVPLGFQTAIAAA